MKALQKILFYSTVGLMSACTADIPYTWDEETTPTTPTESHTPDYNPEFNDEIAAYDGTMASDAGNDVVGSDKTIYWEANSFTNKIYVTFNGSTAKVETSLSNVVSNVDGAYVTVDLATNTVKNADIIVSGSSTDGSLKIYGLKKFKLTLNGVSLESKRGPAINNQCKKRMFLHLTNGTKNVLKDSKTYAAESYYMNGMTMATEDAKGCLFSESNIVLSGTGLLDIYARHNHGIAADGYIWVRPGVTIAIEESAKNGIQAKGSLTDNLGVVIAGGYIYANVSADAAKCIKTDNNLLVSGGILELNCSSKSAYDSTTADLSSGACLKSDLTTTIRGGALILKCTGNGSRNINADGSLTISDGKIICTNTGSDASANGLTSTPKTINSNTDITVSGGTLISVCPNSTASTHMATINGGYIVSIGNGALTNPSSTSKQAYAKFDDVSLKSGKTISLAIGTECILNYELSIPKKTTAPVLFSSPEINSSTTYSVLSGGSVSGATDAWCGFSRQGTYTTK